MVGYILHKSYRKLACKSTHLFLLDTALFAALGCYNKGLGRLQAVLFFWRWLNICIIASVNNDIAIQQTLV